MGNQHVTVKVYGADKVCASCVGAPSSKETFEWLKAALSRKYNDPIDYVYIDIFEPQLEYKDFAQRVIDEDLFYPVVMVNDEIVGEGIPQIKPIYKAMEKLGVK